MTAKTKEILRNTTLITAAALLTLIMILGSNRMIDNYAGYWTDKCEVSGQRQPGA